MITVVVDPHGNNEPLRFYEYGKSEDAILFIYRLTHSPVADILATMSGMCKVYCPEKNLTVAEVFNGTLEEAQKAWAEED